ncbi:hypothetical protein EVAR_11433_1 [Eumeta japonica]|uniref:Uncharacterized protein n=1 Tax=Eumeta variegata TaxID=151549 RepID=A0A4C1TKV7_EUMVA|nr:hypothetical protein EVAR_11433_1 [Eumeta japonica]
MAFKEANEYANYQGVGDDRLPWALTSKRGLLVHCRSSRRRNKIPDKERSAPKELLEKNTISDISGAPVVGSQTLLAFLSLLPHPDVALEWTRVHEKVAQKKNVRLARDRHIPPTSGDRARARARCAPDATPTPAPAPQTGTMRPQIYEFCPSSLRSSDDR